MLFSAIGMAALLAGVANTPIAATVIAMELFGTSVAPFVGIAAVISFVISGKRSIFSAQVLTIKNVEQPLLNEPETETIERRFNIERHKQHL